MKDEIIREYVRFWYILDEHNDGHKKTLVLDDTSAKYLNVKLYTINNEATKYYLLLT